MAIIPELVGYKEMEKEMVTKEDAKQAAKKGLIPALKCSIEHHKDPARMSSLELQIAKGNRIFGIYGEYCALCFYFGGKNNISPKCKKCPLGPISCCSEWDCLSSSLPIFIADPSTANHKAFLEDEEKMVARLERELSNAEVDKIIKVEAEAKCKAEEVTYSAGDKFKYSSNREFMLIYSVTNHSVIMVELYNGRSFASPTPVADECHITLIEMQRHIASGFDEFTRYWDARKKEKC